MPENTPDVIAPEAITPTTETLYEHLELAHYIDVFRSSAERVRRVIFIIMVFSVVMFVAQWNTVGVSWVAIRYQNLNKLYSDVNLLPEKDADKKVKETGRFSTRTELAMYLDEYRKRRIEKIVLVDIPFLGITFDINDLGNFYGVAHALLLILLLFSLMREHENLFLALFKVRRLHDHDRRKKDGESTANYLYHALAMSQVLSSPPTLAQWDPPWVKIVALRIIYFVPTFVQTFVVWTNWHSLSVAKSYGVSELIMAPQYGLLVLNLVIALLALVYSRSCDKRWRSTFLHINPAFAHVQSRPWATWVGLRPAQESSVQRRLWSQAVATLDVREDYNEVIEVEDSIGIKTHRISYNQVTEMGQLLEGQAIKILDDRYNGAHGAHLLDVEVPSSVLRGESWKVKAKFFIWKPVP